MSEILIEAGKRHRLQSIRELVDYQDLLLTLVYRDIKVRYAQTFLGLLWVLIQPIATLLIFTVVFGQVLAIDTGDVPYPLFAFVGISMWTYFSFVMSQSGNSIISAQGLIKKVYFPRLVIPLSKALVGLIDYGVVLVLLFVMIVYAQVPLSPRVFFVPVFIFINLIVALGVGIWLSAITVRYRDFQHIVPFIIQLGIYISPVAFPAEVIIGRFPAWVGALYYLNPMAGVIEGMRWALFGQETMHPYAYISWLMMLLLLVFGILYFSKVERQMADIV